MKDKISQDIKQAMRDKDTLKLNVLRAVKTEISNAALRKGNIDSDVSDADVVSIIRKQIKQRQDSVESFIDAGRTDLVSKESSEIDILTDYLPKDLTDPELDALIAQSVSKLESPSKKDMGKVIKEVKELSDGRADGKRISTRVSELLQ